MANGINGNGNGNGSALALWKWVAGILVAMLIAGLPGYLALLTDDSPSAAAFSVVVDRQNAMLQRLAVLEARTDRADEDRATIMAQLNAILIELRNHELATQPKGR